MALYGWCLLYRNGEPGAIDCQFHGNVTGEEKTLRAVNPRTWIKKTDYLDLEFRPSLRSFATQRADLLAVLSLLPPEGWERSATLTGAGKVLERTVLFYAQWLARHERQHVKQVVRIVNTMHR